MNGSRELRVKVSSEKVAEHRAALVATARRLLQERGFDGAAVTEISRAAGLTQGALYGQFKSKDALAAEAIRNSVAERTAFWDDLRDTPNALLALLDAYLCEAHAEDPGAGCTLAACVSEIGRQDVAIADAYAEGFRRLADLVQQLLPTGTSPEETRRRSIALVSGMVGGVAIARALNKVDPELAKEVLVATREELERLGLSTSVSAAI
jgi:TetR/AcrR family transcriptional regulator, transcriptional repressor for nem operon